MLAMGRLAPHEVERLGRGESEQGRDQEHVGGRRASVHADMAVNEELGAGHAQRSWACA